MELSLKKLTIRNFKGIKDLAFAPDGYDSTIFGDNAAGKTSVYDAFSFLLTGKDSLGIAQFGLKPIGIEGPCPDIEVEGVFDIGGQDITLKKIQSEKHTRKRGSAATEFTGNETAYFINEVPAREKGYQEKIKDLVGGDGALLRMLTNPRTFNEELDWKARRKILIDLCGDVSDADVVATDPDRFERIPTITANKSAAEYRSELEYKRKGVNQELKAVPVRIDELEKSLPEKTADAGALVNDKADAESRLSVLRNQLSMIESGGSAGAKKSELLDVQNKIREIEQGIRKKHDEEWARLRKIVTFCRDEYEGADRRMATLKMDLAAAEAVIEKLSGNIAFARTRWAEENDKTFTTSGACPACGQQLPEEKRAEALAEFNRLKADMLSAINADGKALAVKKTEAEERKAKLAKEVEEASVKLGKLKTDFDNAKKAAAEDTIADHPTAPDLLALIDQATVIESELSEIALGLHDETSGINSEIAEETAKLAEINKALAEISAAEKTRTRIEELAADEKRLAKTYEEIESDLILLEEFTRAKCDLLTDRINSRFRITSWRLFYDQINGGLTDTCIATVDGVPYSDLNNAMKIRCGADIVRALQGFYGASLPVWFDNKESITGTIDMKCQTINLVVSEKDKTLRVEIDTDKNIKKAA